MLFRGRQAVYKQVSLIVTLLYKHILLERLLYYKSIDKKSYSYLQHPFFSDVATLLDSPVIVALSLLMPTFIPQLSLVKS